MNVKTVYLRLYAIGTALMASSALTAMSAHNESVVETSIARPFWTKCKKIISQIEDCDKYIPRVEKHSKEDIAQDVIALAQALITTHATVGFKPLAHLFHDAYLRLQHALTPARNFVPKTDPLKTLPPTSQILAQQFMHYIKQNHRGDPAYGSQACPLISIQHISHFATGYKNHDTCLTQGPFNSSHFKQEVLKKIIEPKLQLLVREHEVGHLPWWGRILHNIPHVEKYALDFDAPLLIRAFPAKAFMRTFTASTSITAITSRVGLRYTVLQAINIFTNIINSSVNGEETPLGSSITKSIENLIKKEIEILLQKRQALQQLSGELDKVGGYQKIMLKNIAIPWFASILYQDKFSTVRLRQNTVASHLFTGAIGTTAHFATQKILSQASPDSKPYQYGLLPWWISPISYGLRYWQACRINQQYPNELNNYKLSQANKFHNKVTDLALIGMRCYSIAAPACRLMHHAFARYTSK
jgi:hypothetical protein